MGIRLLILIVMYWLVFVSIGPAYSIKCYSCGNYNISCAKPAEVECENPKDVCLVEFDGKQKTKIDFSMCDEAPPRFLRKLAKPNKMQPSGRCYCETDLCNDFNCGSAPEERSAESSKKSGSSLCQLTQGMIGLPILFLSLGWLFTQL